MNHSFLRHWRSIKRWSKLLPEFVAVKTILNILLFLKIFPYKSLPVKCSTQIWLRFRVEGSSTVTLFFVSCTQFSNLILHQITSIELQSFYIVLHKINKYDSDMIHHLAFFVMVVASVQDGGEKESSDSEFARVTRH